MDLVKIGAFLKELRKEKNITQEELADKMGVSRRTVSRWETGANMPDMDILIDISDFYDVDLREILDGERKDLKMDNETKETVLKVAEVSNEEKAKIVRNIHVLFIIAMVFMGILIATNFIDAIDGHLREFLNGMSMGVGFGMIVVGAIMTSKYAKDIRDFKMRLIGRGKDK
ncbi:MAG: helix-turn-helix domain-containing protein [Saccharofermentans sp.]|nr:helix-turn-helix domain-containing protein [Saccharofermentans sp.]